MSPIDDSACVCESGDMPHAAYNANDKGTAIGLRCFGTF